MANREENLKKINAELEKLDDEQLEKIAGGKHHPRLRISNNENESIANSQVGLEQYQKYGKWLE